MRDTNALPGWARADVLRLHRQRCGDAAGGRAGGAPSRHWIVLAHAELGGHIRILRRWSAGPRLPLVLCPVDDTPCLVEQMVGLSRRLGAESMDLVLRAEAPPLPASLRHRVDRFSTPAEVGTAIGLLRPLVAALVRNPACTVVIAPQDTGWLQSEGLARALARAQARVDAGDEIVALGAEPGALAPWAGADAPARAWLVPFGLRGRATDVPIARIADRACRLEAHHIASAGGLCATGFVVASGMRLLQLFEELTPRLLRLFLFGVTMPTGDHDAFFSHALEGLGPLDLVGDVLSLARRLRAIVVPDAAGVCDLRGEVAAATWLARRRSLSLSQDRGSRYRRVKSGRAPDLRCLNPRQPDPPGPIHAP